MFDTLLFMNKIKHLKLSPFSRQLFKEWDTLAYIINSFQLRLEFNEREIWSCYLGMNVGDEQMGTNEDFLRPVIILKKFNSKVCWAIPLTRTDKKSVHYFPFNFITGTQSVAILSQLRLIDSKRLKTMIGKMKNGDFIKLKEKLTALLS